MDYVIGVDIGTQSTKALLVDAQGTIIAQHSHGYRVDTPKVRWAEQWPQVWLEAVEACVAQCMAKSGVAVPTPIADRTGGLFSILNGRPAALTQRINGRPQMQPSVVHCIAVGRELGRLHNASRNFRTRISNKRGPAWTLSTSRAVRAFVTADQNALIENEIKFQRERRQTRLPNGAIHADLFRDNVLFDGDNLSGLIDFGFAATDEFAYDLAITANDWCVIPGGEFDNVRLVAFLKAYVAERPLSEAEQMAWPALLRAAAIRFWLSRLYDLHLPRAAELNTPHDPSVFERILRLRIEQTCFWPIAEINDAAS